MSGATLLPWLNARTLAKARGRTPPFDRSQLGVGIVHLGLGAFHRAHQAVFTEDAVIAEGGDWGIVGVALQRPDTPDALQAQSCLYTVETLGEEQAHRVMGVLKGALYAGRSADAVLGLIAAPTTHVVTLTVTEKGYALDGAGELDFGHADIRHDLAEPGPPRSMIGWLVAGLERRRQGGAGTLTVLSCDNLARNGDKLQRAVLAFAAEVDHSLAAWIEDHVAVPNGMVDCIVPGATEAAAERVASDLGLWDRCSVQREPFAQWVIEDRFAGPRPAWDAVGVELVGDVAPFERMKLHVLNGAHSALAYLGLERGLTYVHQAIADPQIGRFLDAMVEEEIAPALAPLRAGPYWAQVRGRFANPMIRYPLAQIAQDGSAKLGQRILPLLIDNVRAGRPAGRLAAVVRAWLAFAGAGEVKDPKAERLRLWRAAGARIDLALADSELFPPAFRSEPALRAVLETSS